MRLDEALERQRAVQRKRTIAWTAFGILVPVSLLFWLEVVFALAHLPEVGILQLLAELIVAFVATAGAVQMCRSGMRCNRLLADASRLLDENGEVEP